MNNRLVLGMALAALAFVIVSAAVVANIPLIQQADAQGKSQPTTPPKDNPYGICKKGNWNVEACQK